MPSVTIQLRKVTDELTDYRNTSALMLTTPHQLLQYLAGNLHPTEPKQSVRLSYP